MVYRGIDVINRGIYPLTCLAWLLNDLKWQILMKIDISRIYHTSSLVIRNLSGQELIVTKESM